MPIFTDPAEEAAFEREGYVTRMLLDADQIEEARAISEEWLAAQDPALLNDWHRQLFGTIFDSDLARRASTSARYTELFTRAIGPVVNDFRVLEPSLMGKGPFASAVGLHRHVAFSDRPFERNMVCWCPLADSDADSGTLMVVPRSQHLYRYLKISDEQDYFVDYLDELTRRHAVAIPLRAGEAIFFENTLLHGSVPNMANHNRLALTIGLIRSDAPHVVYRRGPNDTIEAIGGEYDHFQIEMMRPAGSRRVAGEVVRSFPAWDRKATLDEVEVLLAANQHATETFDPLAALCGAPKPAAPAPRAERPTFRDPELATCFKSAGYVAVPMLDPQQVAAALADLATLLPEDNFAPDGSGFAENSYHWSFLDDDPAYKGAAFELLIKHFGHVVNRYLDGYRVLAANFFVKPPGSGVVPVHQNWPVLKDLAATSVTIWCPLVDVDVRNGTLHVVPGSHKLLPHVEGPGSPAYFTPFIDRMYDHMMPLSASAGQGFIFDDGIVHGSPPNRADSPRIAVQLICVPAESQPVHFFKDSETGFELIDADMEFYLRERVSDLTVRKPTWHGRGRVDSRNRLIDETEFLALLAQGDVIRRHGFDAARTPGTQIGISSLPRRVLRRARREALRILPDRAKPVLRRLAGRAATAAAGPNPVRDARLPSETQQVGQVRAYYEEMTPAYRAGFGDIFQGSRPESTDALLDYLVDAAAIADGMRVLDAGCGVGGPAIGIAERRAVTIEGLTLAQAQADQAALGIAERGLADRVTVRQGDYHDIGERYEAESFDRVLFLESLCHAENYAAVLKGAHRVLKTGGGLYIKDFYCVDNRARPAMAAGQIEDLNKLNSLYRLQLPDLASMVDLLSELGFVIRYMRMPDYEPSYRHWAAYEELAGNAWNPASAEPGDIIQAVEFFCWKR